jgi:hypothetical protein
MESTELCAEQSPTSKLVEIDPSLWTAIPGGVPRNGWLTAEQVFGTAAELQMAGG